MGDFQFSEAALKETIRSYISQLRIGAQALLILISELTERKNWETPLPSTLPKAKKYSSLVEMKAAYQARVKNLIDEGKCSSREEDDIWARFHSFPTTVIRKFRNEYVPLSWRSKGRRPSKI